MTKQLIELLAARCYVPLGLLSLLCILWMAGRATLLGAASKVLCCQSSPLCASLGADSTRSAAGGPRPQPAMAVGLQHRASDEPVLCACTDPASSSNGCWCVGLLMRPARGAGFGLPRCTRLPLCEPWCRVNRLVRAHGLLLLHFALGVTSRFWMEW